MGRPFLPCFLPPNRRPLNDYGRGQKKCSSVTPESNKARSHMRPGLAEMICSSCGLAAQAALEQASDLALVDLEDHQGVIGLAREDRAKLCP
jgi:hypothetical protein